MTEWKDRKWKVVRAVYADSDFGEYAGDDRAEYRVKSLRPGAEPVGYTFGGEEVGSLEELALRLETAGDEVDLCLDMNDRDVARLYRIRREMAGK